MKPKCPKCGKFIGKVYCTYKGADGDKEIVFVFGICKTHKEVDITNTWDWDYENFFPR